MDIDKQKRFLIRLLYLAAVLGIVIFLCRVALPKLWEFCVALIVAWLLKPVIRFLKEKCHIHKTAAGIVLTVLFYAVIGFIIALISVKLFALVKGLVLSLPSFYYQTLEPLLTKLFSALESFAEKLNPTAAAAYDSALSKITGELETGIATLSKKLLGFATDTAMSVPGGLFSTLIMIVATIFLAIDWDKITGWMLYQLSPEKRTLVFNVVSTLKSTLGQYLRSYALILSITFVELFIGLVILGIPNTIGLAALIAVFDILPVVGSGTVLIPWAAVSLILGNYLQALGLAILYIVIVVIRNVMEPKIIGDRVGLHPIVTLASMVVGTYVFGPIGLLGFPVAMALMHTLNEQGKIHLFRIPPGDKGPGSQPRNASKRPFGRRKGPKAPKTPPPPSGEEHVPMEDGPLNPSRQGENPPDKATDKER